MKTFLIYFNDLNEDAQRRLLKAVKAEDASDMNWDMDICPIAMYDFEDDGEDEENCIKENYICPEYHSHLKNYSCPITNEYTHSIIDIFEYFLKDKNIEIPNKESDDIKSASIIYGKDFDNLFDSVYNKLSSFEKYKKANNDIINKIWDLAKISPEHGNALMDLLGEDKYNYVMRNHTRN